MATPGFGFSVGDFITVISLLNEVRNALKDSGGAEEELNEVLLDLQQLEIILKWLESGEWGKSGDLGHVNAVRGMALTCQVPLREFWVKIQKYRVMINGQSQIRDTKGKLKGIVKKIQWAVQMKDEVTNFRKLIVAKIATLNLLVAIPMAPRLAKLENDIAKSDRRAHEESSSLLEKVDDCLVATKRVAREGRIINESQAGASYNISRLVEICTGTRLDVMKVQEVVRSQYRGFHTRIAKMERQQQRRLAISYGTFGNRLAQIERALKMIPSSAQTIGLCVTNLRMIIEQLHHKFGEFSIDVLRTLHQVLRTNLEIYALLRRIQDQLPSSPAPNLQDCIHFEDALGRTQNLEYKWFRHWEVFESMLKCEFNTLPGGESILKGRYYLMRGDKQRHIITKEDWSQLVFPGVDLHMSIIVESQELDRGMCPRPGCFQRNLNRVSAIQSVICPCCHLEYYEEQDEYSIYFPRIQELDNSLVVKMTDENSMLPDLSRYTWGGNDLSAASSRLESQVLARPNDPTNPVVSPGILQIFKSIHIRRKCLKDYVFECCTNSCLVYESPETIHEIVELLTARAPVQHRFIWAEAMILFLDKVNDQSTHQVLSELPRELDQVYDMMMCHIDDESWQLARQAFSCLLRAKRPIPVKELEQQLSASMNQIISVCKFLIREIEGSVYFIDNTVCEFLERSYAQWWGIKNVYQQLEEAKDISQKPEKF